VLRVFLRIPRFTAFILLIALSLAFSYVGECLVYLAALCSDWDADEVMHG